MLIDETRLARQNICIDRWEEANYNGILDMHTGTGKTYTASLGIRRLDKKNPSTYLIVVPGPELVIQWQKKLKEYFPKHLLDRTLIKTSSTILSENLKYEVGTLIIDEIHEFHTEERLKIIDGSIIKAKNVLGLTASGDDKNFWKIKRYLKIVDYISAEEATEKGYVAEFIEYNLFLELSLREREIYDKLSESISKNMPKFNNNIKLAHNVLQGGKDESTGKYYAGPGWAHGLALNKGWRQNLNLSIPEQKIIDDLWNPNKIIGYARNLINAVRGRRDLLCTTNAKYNTTLEIINKFNKVKTIIFSESTTFADKIGLLLNKANHPTVVYHSQLKTIMTTSPKSGKFIKMGKVRLKREALDKIRTGRARVLSTARSLDKGLDIPDLRMGITTSGSQDKTQYKQRSGRPTRKEESSISDEPVLLINLVMKDTQDEVWLTNRQKTSKHESIEITSVDEITYTPQPNVEFSMLDL